MTDKSKWFQPPMLLKAPSKKRQPLAATEIERLCNIVDLEKPAKTQKHLYVSQLCRIGDPIEMRKALVSYWVPIPQTIDYKGELYTEIGKLIESIHIRRLHLSGVCKCVEFTDCAWDEQHPLKIEELGISGKLDAIIDFTKAKHLGAKTLKDMKEEDQSSVWVVEEVKSTGTEKYKLWTEFDKLPDDYLTQFSFYVEYGYKLKSVDKREGFFTIISRDLAHRTLWGEPRMDLLDAGLKNAEKFWHHVQNRTIPGETDTSWIETQIKLQPDRDWHELAKIN